MGALLGCGGRRRVDLWGWVRFGGGWAGLLGVFGRVRSLGDVWSLWERFLLVCLVGCGRVQQSWGRARTPVRVVW